MCRLDLYRPFHSVKLYIQVNSHVFFLLLYWFDIMICLASMFFGIATGQRGSGGSLIQFVRLPLFYWQPFGRQYKYWVLPRASSSHVAVPCWCMRFRIIHQLMRPIAHDFASVGCVRHTAEWKCLNLLRYASICFGLRALFC